MVLENFFSVKATFGYLIISTVEKLTTILQNKYLRAFPHKLQLVSYKNDAFFFKHVADCMVKNVICDCRIYCTQRVIQQVDVSILIDRSR
jgi:hypothetical protein